MSDGPVAGRIFGIPPATRHLTLNHDAVALVDLEPDAQGVQATDEVPHTSCIPVEGGRRSERLRHKRRF